MISYDIAYLIIGRFSLVFLARHHHATIYLIGCTYYNFIYIPFDTFMRITARLGPLKWGCHGRTFCWKQPLKHFFVNATYSQAAQVI